MVVHLNALKQTTPRAVCVMVHFDFRQFTCREQPTLINIATNWEILNKQGLFCLSSGGFIYRYNGQLVGNTSGFQEIVLITHGAHDEYILVLQGGCDRLLYSY